MLEATTPEHPFGTWNQNSDANSILFLDASVRDYQSLIAGVTPGTEVVLLDPKQDGVEQISEILSKNTDIKSVHIVSHGAAGSLQLGESHLGLDNLNNYTGELQHWASALTPDADILLYGCDVATGETGKDFVRQLSQLTGADVAASDDLTGSATLHGDWDLEVKTGSIEAPLAFQLGVMQTYNSVFASVNLIGQTTFASNSTFGGTTIGGISGITYDAVNNQYYAISDAKNDADGPVRFYKLNIDLSSGSLSSSGVTFTGVTLLKDSGGNQFPANVSDTEGIAFTNDGNAFISSEGMFTGSQQFIDRFNLTTGNQNLSLPIPSPKYDVSADTSSGIRNNRGFESLTITPDGKYLFTATEVALEQDSTLTSGSPSRIVKYNLSTNSVEAEFVYNSDTNNGISELLALDGNTLLVLDRNVFAGFGKLYQASLQNATDIKNNNGLIASGLGGITAAQKTLVSDLSNFDLGTNFEGMTFGPTLPNGKLSLILVADNNFGAVFGIPTRFAAFEFNPDTPPAIDLNGSDSGTGYNATFTRGGGAVAIVDSNKLTVADDGNIISRAEVTIANLLDGNNEVLAIAGPKAVEFETGITTSYANGKLILEGEATKADYEQVLRTVT